MVNHLYKWGAVLVMVSVLSGCSNGASNVSKPAAQVDTPKKVVEQVPKPYTMAMDSLNNSDLDHALQYLDLTIHDFPDSKYVYDSNLIKSVILNSKLRAIDLMNDDIDGGIQKGGVFFKSADIDKLKGYLDKGVSEMDKAYSPFKESVTFIQSHFNKSITDNTYKIDFKAPSTNDTSYHTVTWFKDVGTPIPEETDLDAFIQDGTFANTDALLHQFIVNGKIDYPKYFYSTAIEIYNNANDKQQSDKQNTKDMVRQLLQRVLDLTEDDKYNQTRLDAQKQLDQLK